MPILTGKSIGDINIHVYESQNGETFFSVEANNENILPILNYVENTLGEY